MYLTLHCEVTAENSDQNPTAFTNLFRTDMDAVSISLQFAVPPENTLFTSYALCPFSSRCSIPFGIPILVGDIQS